MIVANFGHFEPEEFFEVDEALRGDAGVPKVDFSNLSTPAPSAPEAPETPPAPPVAEEAPPPPPG